MSRRIRTTVLLLAGLIVAAPASAVTRYVTTSGVDAGNNECSLTKPCRTVRHAVDYAKANDTIQVGPGEFLETGPITVYKSLTIKGAGSLSTAIIMVVEGRVFDIAANLAVNIIGVAIRGGHTEFDDGAGIRNKAHLALIDVQIRGNTTKYGDGGGIANVYEGDGMHPVLTMTQVLIADNTAASGGGLFNSTYAEASLTDCYFLGNTATGLGGGIQDYGKLKANRLLIEANNAGQVGGGVYTGESGYVELRNLTLTGNGGGGVFALGWIVLTHATIADNVAADGAGITVSGTVGHASLRNSIVANNTGPQCARHVTEGAGLNVVIDGIGTVVSDGSCGLWPSNNLVDDDLKLGVFKNYGGLLPTYELLTGSPAIDFGQDLYCEAYDQRAFVRSNDGDFDGVKECDAGAFEYGADPPAGGPLPPLPKGWYLGPWHVYPTGGGSTRR